MKIIPRLFLTIFAVALTLLATALPAAAQTPGTVDSTYNPAVTGGYVLATAVQPDGKTIIGGRFSMVGGAAHANLARLNADGSVDTTFVVNTNEDVGTVTVQADGKILLGGAFTLVNGMTFNRIARLTSNGTLDTGFNPNANSFVVSVAVQTDGKILLGGAFTALQPNGATSATTRNKIARLNSDGSLDTGFDPNPNDGVTSVAVQADGKILLGGVFTTLQPNGASSATTRNRIARLNSDGSLDTGFNPNAIGSVFTVAVQADGKILLGGQFTTLQPNGAPSATTRNNIARLNSDGTLDTGFDPNASADVNSVAVQADGKILLGGGFTTLQPNGASSATTRNRIARLNSDGSLDPGFDPNADNAVYSVAMQADGKILLGGAFTMVGGTAQNRIARLNNDNASQSLSAPDSTRVQWLRGGAAPEVEQVTFELSVNGGSTWSALGAGTRITGGWQRIGLSLPATGSLRARGHTTNDRFNSGSGLIEQVDDFGPAGSVGAAYNPKVTGAGGSTVLATAVQPDGKTIIGGAFTALQPNGAPSPTTRNRIARVNSDGSLDTGFNPSANADVNSVAVQADGKILLGGVFTTLQPNGAPSATTRNHIARLNSDGTLDTGFDPNANNSVFSVAVQADGKILLGGVFTTLQPNGAPGAAVRSHIARLNSDGTLDPGFNPDANSEVRSVVVQADGDILLGGLFTALQPNGAPSATTRNHIARLHSGGTLDTGFNPNASALVLSVAVQADRKILLGGNFTKLQPNGAPTATTRIGIARVNSDGTVDGFDPNANDGVNSVAVQADGKILLGGAFSALQPNGAPSATTRNGIARVNSDGSLDTGFNPSANADVNSVAVQADGKILLGGAFSAVGGTTRNLIARLNNDAAPQSLSTPDSARAQWLRGGAAPEVEQVTFELSTNGPWSVLGAGTRIAGGWELTRLSLPASGSLRARGHTTNGYENGGSGLIEQVQSFAPTPSPTPGTPTATPTPTPTPTSGSLGNISTRLQVGTGNNVLFAGFIIQGSASKTVLIRSAGPSLTSFGVPGALGNPQLELHDANNTIGTNDNWQTTQVGGVITSDQVAAIQNSGAAPADPAEPAIIATLPAGSYTAIVQGVGGTQGVATAEVYDLSPNNGATLANISTRGFIQTGDNVMIGGFIVVGQSSKVLIRATGPSLIPFGINNALTNPRIELHDANGTLAGNDDWQTTQLGGIITSDQSVAIQNSGLAPSNPAESAIIATLAPGAYTAIAQGVNGGTGVGLVEVFALP